MSNLLTEPQLAERLGVSKKRLQQWAAQERIRPALTLPNGQRLYRPGTKRPKPRKAGNRTGRRDKRGRFA